MKKKAKKVAKKKTKKASKKVKAFKSKPAPKEKFVPLGDRVLVRPEPVKETSTTEFGILIPDTVSKEKPETGVVVSVGMGKVDDGIRVPMTVTKGDRVMFSKYGYDEVKIDGEEFYILKEENILGIIN